MSTDIEQLAVDTIRVLSMDAIQKANSGIRVRHSAWRTSPWSCGRST